MSGERKSRATSSISAEPSAADVEELLRAAQDDLLLKLTVNTHTTTTLPSSSLDPDLSRRFDALRSHRPPAPPPKLPPPETTSKQRADAGAGAPNPAAATSAAAGHEETRGGGGEGKGDEVSKILGEDLAARFAALKGTSSSYLPADHIARKPDRIPKEDHADGDDDDDSEGSDDDEEGGGVSEKEVEKLIQWAMDAARLDPDPIDGDDNEGIGKEEEDEDGEEGSSAAAKAAADEKKKKEAEGKKPSTRKWRFFF